MVPPFLETGVAFIVKYEFLSETSSIAEIETFVSAAVFVSFERKNIEKKMAGTSASIANKLKIFPLNLFIIIILSYSFSF